MIWSQARVQFESVSTGKVLDRIADSRDLRHLRLATPSDALSQQWTIRTDTHDVSAILTVVEPGSSALEHAIGLCDDQLSNGEPLCMDPFTGSDAQRFYIEVNGDGNWTIRSLQCGRVIDAGEGDVQDGAPVRLWDDYRLARQRWRIVVVGR